MFQGTEINSLAKEPTGLAGCSCSCQVRLEVIWTPSIMRKKADRSDSSQILGLCHLLRVCASRHLWSRTSRVEVTRWQSWTTPRRDSDVVLAVCRKWCRRLGHTLPCLSKSILLISDGFLTPHWPLTVWFYTLVNLKNKNASKRLLDLKKGHKLVPEQCPSQHIFLLRKFWFRHRPTRS